MVRLTEKDEQGNWMLKGIPWESLREGKVITKELHEKLYGALWKLTEYEETDLPPKKIYEIDQECRELSREVAKLRKEMTWIPVAEGLPENNPDADYYDTVIVTLKNGLVTAGYYCNHEKEWWGDITDGEYSNLTGQVVAWMVLPERFRKE